MQSWNALKYFSVVVALAVRIAYTRSGSDEWKIVAWITSVISAIAVIYWDIVLDWGLLQRKSVNPWLRDKLLVSHKSVYFVAIVSTSQTSTSLYIMSIIEIRYECCCYSLSAELGYIEFEYIFDLL